MYGSDYNQHAFMLASDAQSVSLRLIITTLFFDCSRDAPSPGTHSLALAVCYYCSLGANALLLLKHQPLRAHNNRPRQYHLPKHLKLQS